MEDHRWVQRKAVKAFVRQRSKVGTPCGAPNLTPPSPCRHPSLASKSTKKQKKQKQKKRHPSGSQPRLPQSGRAHPPATAAAAPARARGPSQLPRAEAPCLPNTSAQVKAAWLHGSSVDLNFFSGIHVQPEFGAAVGIL